MMINKMVAVMAACMVAGAGYVAGKANTPTEITPANIYVAKTEAIKNEVEPEIDEGLVEVEEEKEEFIKIEKILNSNGNLREFRVYTKGAYDNVANVISYKYLPDACEYINEYTTTSAAYYERNGRFVVVDIVANKEIDVDVFKAVE